LVCDFAIELIRAWLRDDAVRPPSSASGCLHLAAPLA
jgi:hypothetical protein